MRKVIALIVVQSQAKPALILQAVTDSQQIFLDWNHRDFSFHTTEDTIQQNFCFYFGRQTE